MSGEFARLQADPYAEVVVAITITATLDGEPKTWRIASAAGIFTEPDEDPPNVAFQDVMLQGWRTERSISGTELIGGASSYNRGELYFENGDGLLSELLDADFSTSTVDVRVGGRRTLDGFRFPWAEFVPLLVGSVESVTPQPGAVLKAKLAGVAGGLDDDLVTASYRGFGGGLYVPARSGATAAVSHASLGINGALTVEFMGRLRTFTADTFAGCLFRQGAASAVNYGFVVAASGAWSFQCGGTGNRVLADASAAMPFEEYRHIAASISSAGAVTLYAGTGADDLVEVGTGTLPPAVANSGPFEIGRLLAGGTANVEPWEIRVWSGVKTLEDLRETADGPIFDPSSEATLIGCWKFGDGTGSTATSEITTDQDLTLSGTSWVPSYEGDDPEQFDGSVIGQTKPRCYGRPKNVSLANTDSQHHALQWEEGESDDILRLYEARVPLFPDETITAAAGELTFTAATSKITLGGTLSAHRFVPGQIDPDRDGMRFDVTGTSKNDGTFTVAANGINSTGKVITVEEALQDETNAGAATLRTNSADRHYTYDLERSAVDLASSPAAQLTADVVARLGAGGTLKASELFEMIAGSAPDITDLEVDPVVSFNAPPGASPAVTKRHVLDGVAQSAMAAWWEERGGGYKLSTWRLPSGDPVATFPDADIDSVVPRETAVPYWQLSVGIQPNWTVMDKNGLPGSVKPADRDFAANSHRYIKRVLIPSANRSPLSQPKPAILTWLEADGIKQLVPIAMALYTGQRRWWEIGLTGVSPLTLDLWDLIYVTYDEPGSGLEAGKLVRVVGMIEDTASDLVLAEVFA